jgi:predicted nucleotidyltransferase
MNPLAVIEAHIAEFQALGARRIGVFGSFVRGKARDDGDVDVYVEFDDAKRCYDNFFALHERLENCSVGAWISSRTSLSPKASV